MSTRKSYHIIIFTVCMILLNFLGKAISSALSLPLWLDGIGTIITAYVNGPFCAAVVGIAGSLIYGIRDPYAILYGIVSVAIGLSVGFLARKKLFDTFFGTLTANVIVTLISVILSTPLNYLLYKGYTGNIWGDGVISYLTERNVHSFIAALLGEFYVDFLDKAITLLILYLLIKAVRFRKQKMIVTTLIPIIILSGFVYFSGTSVRAEDEIDININNIQTVYSSDNGLPCGSANDIIQTNDGILWVGTYAGLYRYNGREFKWMNEYDSVRNVNCLFYDEEGRLWIGTNDNGFSISINEKITNVVDESDGLSSNSVRCITQCSDGNYYIGTTSSLQIMSLDGGLGFVGELPEIEYAHSIASDKNGNVAVVTNAGKLFIVNSGEITASIETGVEQEKFQSVSFDDSGVLYAGTSTNNIYYYNVTDGVPEKENFIICGSLVTINNLYFTSDGYMYICSDSGVGYLDSLKKFHYINTGSFKNSIDNMTIDYQGNLWFASSRLGLLKVSRSLFSDIYRMAGLKSSVVNSVAIWQGGIYAGTDSGLDIIDMKSMKPYDDNLTAKLNGVRVRCLTVDSNDNLWICTYGKGLLKVAKNRKVLTFDSKTMEFGDWVRVAVELEDGTIAASCNEGLGFFKENELVKLIKYNEGLGKSAVLCIEQMSDGRVICGSDGDGIFVVENGEVTSHYTTKNGLSADVVLRVIEDTEGNGLYIITSNGFCYMDKNGNIRLLEDFPYYNNYDVWPCDNGNLFVLGSAGIYVVNRENILNPDEKMDYDLLDSRRGLNSALTVNSWDYMDEEGNLYLSTDNGVFVVNTNNFALSRKSYRMMIASVNLDNESHEIERGEAFHIGRDISKIEIIPEVINYTADDPIVEYYLEGFESTPSYIPQSELTNIVYTNLPAGDYKLHLCILDSKKEKVIEESVYELVKENEIHDTGWFHVYMLFVAMLAVAWLTWFIARTQIQRTLNFQRKELEFARKQIEMGNETILAIAKTVDAKDEYTSQHSQRVSEYSVLIGKELGFTDEECENLKKVALLHDIGKIGIPDRVLNKPGKLTDEEYAIMKSHPVRGAKILKDFTIVEHAIEGALYHHEKYDGTGYPQGLAGEDIPLYGRIIGVADAFDAMTENRVYRKKLDFSYVMNELKRCSGTQFDPKLVDIMFKLVEEKKIDFDTMYASKNTATENKEVQENKAASENKESQENSEAPEKKENDGEGDDK